MGAWVVGGWLVCWLACGWFWVLGWFVTVVVMVVVVVMHLVPVCADGRSHSRNLDHTRNQSRNHFRNHFKNPSRGRVAPRGKTDRSGFWINQCSKLLGRISLSKVVPCEQFNAFSLFLLRNWNKCKGLHENEHHSWARAPFPKSCAQRLANSLTF